MPGSGKSTIVSALKARSLESLNLGDGIRDEAKKRNLEPTGENLGRLMLELRDKMDLGQLPTYLQKNKNYPI